jgi:CRISPR/Cas system-associated exonuclease Cas4 (RecB family)
MPELKTDLSTPFTFSQSSLQDYVDCARRFQLRYIEQLQWPAVETAPVLENERRQLEGQQFHRMAQQHLLGLPAEKLAKMANSENLSRWWGNFTNSDLTGFENLSGLKRYPELTLSAPLGQHRILAKYDLVAVKDGHATIFDWKTSHKRPKNKWMSARLQTKVYRALLAEAGKHLNGGAPFQPEQIEMIYWYADFPSEPSKFSYNAAQHKRTWDDLVKLVSEISAKQSYPMTDDEKKCGYCPYRSYCERGIRAGEGEEGESELTVAEISLEQIQEIEF